MERQQLEYRKSSMPGNIRSTTMPVDHTLKRYEADEANDQSELGPEVT
jgi:hypothetical protein